MDHKFKKFFIEGCVGVAVTVLLAIIIVLITRSTKSLGGPHCSTCSSEKCILSANNLLQSMDRNIDPCEDFYNYACGNWTKEHPMADTGFMNSWLNEQSVSTMRKVRDFLSTDNTNEPLAWQKAKTMYRSCINENKLQSLGMEPVLKMIEDIGLRGPSELFYNSSSPAEEWYSVAAKAKKLFSLDIFIGLSIKPVYNSGTNRIILSPPSYQNFLPTSVKTDEILRGDTLITLLAKDKKQISASSDRTLDQKALDLHLKLNHTAFVMGKIFNMSRPEFWNMLRDFRKLDGQIYTAANNLTLANETLLDLLQAVNETEDLTNIEDKSVIHISIDDFQKFTDSGIGSSQINWGEYFRVIFKDIDASVSGCDKIIVTKPGYFKRLATIMSNNTREIIDMLIYWKVMDSVAIHTTDAIRWSTEKILKFTDGREANEARSMVCTRAVTNAMEMAILSYIINSELSNNNEEKVREMFANIKEAFLHMITASDWLDVDTKNLMKEKIQAIPLLTYPKWILDEKKLEEYYEGVKLTEGQFLLSAVNISKWKMQKVLSSLRTGKLSELLLRNPLSSNAYYLDVSNSITVLHNFLKFPFFDLGLEALNYGLLGFILGHELHHAFDLMSIIMTTNASDSWEVIDTLKEFLNRRKCFIEDYNTFGWEDGLKVNGANTANENMADNGGLQSSLLAYQALKGAEPKLPGLENYTHEQLFFLSFANFFCSEMREAIKVTVLKEVHSPDPFRLLGAVTNSKEFSRIWGCRQDAKMNPRGKCTLW